jgi:hypothetical protein
VAAASGVAADLLVDDLPDEDELPVCRSEAAPGLWLQPLEPLGILQEPMPKSVRVVNKGDMEHGEHELFAPGQRNETGPGGEEVGPGRLRHGQRRGEHFRNMSGVGVEKKEVLALRGGGELVAGPPFSRPAGGKLLPGEDAQTGGRVIGVTELTEDIAGAVFGIVVENEDFVIRVSLAGERGGTRTDPEGFIACRDEDGDQRGVPGRGSLHDRHRAKRAHVQKHHCQTPDKKKEDQNLVGDHSLRGLKELLSKHRSQSQSLFMERRGVNNAW